VSNRQVTGERLGREQIRSLYEQHGPALLAYAISLLRDRSASEDVLHHVFMKLLKGGVRIDGSPLHYLYRAIRNTAFNHRRDHAREIELPSNGHWLESPPGMEDIGIALETAMRDLPEEQREVVMLRVWGQMTLEEAAATLDISINTAASRYRYALAKLKAQLRPLPKE
jgi:RNA polymerase sigma-70 factor (ECF subfamily)